MMPLRANGRSSTWAKIPLVQTQSHTREFGKGFFAWLKGDAVGAQASFTKARVEQEKLVDAQGDYGPALIVLGLVDAALGRKNGALREGFEKIIASLASKQ